LLELYLIINQEVHKALFFLWRQQAKNEGLRRFLISTAVPVVADWGDAS
jgi:hypothetical protein